MTTAHTEALFYHLTRRSIEQAAADLLERTLARRWRATVRVGLDDRVDVLSEHLWRHRDDAFLPHGTAHDGFSARQPIYITAGNETPNDPELLMLVHRAEVDDADLTRFQRLVVLFEGHDTDSLTQARTLWRRAVDADCAAQYWAEDATGRWSKQHERS